MRVLGSLIATVVVTMSGASTAQADACGCPAVALTPGTPLAAVLHPTVSVDVDAAFEISVTAYLRIGSTSLGRIGTFTARATQTPEAIDLPVSPALLDRARSVARRTGHARGMVEFLVTGPGSARMTNESFVSLRRPVRATASRLDVGRSVQGARQDVRGSVVLRTPAWHRSSAPGAALATFIGIPAGDRCVADLIAQATVRAGRTIATFLDEFGPGDSNGTASDAWRLSSTAPGSTLPHLDAIGARRVAHNRYAVLRLHVAFRPGCPPEAARTRTLVTAVRRAVSPIATDVHLR